MMEEEEDREDDGGGGGLGEEANERMLDMSKRIDMLMQMARMQALTSGDGMPDRRRRWNHMVDSMNHGASGAGGLDELLM